MNVGLYISETPIIIDRFLLQIQILIDKLCKELVNMREFV
jgi:hypothetical protein